MSIRIYAFKLIGQIEKRLTSNFEELYLESRTIWSKEVEQFKF